MRKMAWFISIVEYSFTYSFAQIKYYHWKKKKKPFLDWIQMETDFLKFISWIVHKFDKILCT